MIYDNLNKSNYVITTIQIYQIPIKQIFVNMSQNSEVVSKKSWKYDFHPLFLPHSDSFKDFVLLDV